MVSALCAFFAMHTQAGPIDSRDKPFNEYSWVTTHNSYEKINQNMKELPQQLKDGVRGFMMDLYYKPQYPLPGESVRVCHKEAMCYGPFKQHLKNEFIPFLRSNPAEVVTIFLETYVTREQLLSVFETVPEIADLSFNPANFSAAQWPTLKEMAAKDNRLVLMSDQRSVAGNYSVNGKNITVLFDQDWIVQNSWDTLGPVATSIEAQHNWSCPARWGNLPLDTAKVAASTGKEWKRLFLMNQFHHVISLTPDSAAYDNNMTYLSRRTDNCGVTPNFVGVNHYASGETHRYTDALNNGGLYFYEARNASRTEDIVCVVPTRQGVVDRKAHGCENDETKSMALSGVMKGTRITLFDSPSGNTQDDHLILDVLRDIGINERIVVPHFEQDYSNTAVRGVFNRNNGLNGKVSRMEISKTPTGFTDASIAFYEGVNASQNLDCVVPFSSSYTLKMKNKSFGCSNDEIKSARITKAKAGSSFTLTGHPEGNFNEGRTTVEILRNVTTPIIIPNFNSSYSNLDVRVTNYTKPIAGWISFGYINGTK